MKIRKPQITILAGLLTIAAISVAMASCTNNDTHAKSMDGRDYRRITIDTLVINGKPHEYLFSRVNSGWQITHSPECWCEKGGEK